MAASLLAVVVDCREPRPQADFWSRVLSCGVVTEGSLDDEVTLLRGLGARLVEVRQDPGTMTNPDTWAVLEDPEGHVFCVSSTATISGWG